MDLESESSVLESVEDNEDIANYSVSESLGDISDSKVPNNGSCAVGNNDEIANFSVSESLGDLSDSKVQNNGSYAVENNDLKQKEAKISGYVGSPPMVLEPEGSPSSSSTKKGYGLRKWRRIRRDANRDVDSSLDAGKVVAHDLPNSGANLNPSKRMQYDERRQKSEGSVSSTNAVVRNLDGFAMLDDSGVGMGLGLGLPFATGTDSENSEDRSSKSSTAASVPKMKYETPVFAGFPRDRSRMRSLSGKNLEHPVQRGQQGKGQKESTKKAKGERVKIEKENSHSSMESDSRSSNFVFMQGTYSVNNGTQNERPNDYDEENSDEVVGCGQQSNNGHRGGYDKDGDGGSGDMSRKDVANDSSWGVNEERSENNGSGREKDPMDESILDLQYVQEALEKELLNIKEIRNNVSVTDPTTSEQSLDGDSLQSSSGALQSEVLETANREAMAELEETFKQKLETEVECLLMSRRAQELRVAAVDHITVLEEQKNLVSEQTQILHKLGDAENKAAALKKEAEKLEIFCQDMASANEILKLQQSVRKYSSCFLIQLVLLALIFGIIFSQFSPSDVEIVPT